MKTAPVSSVRDRSVGYESPSQFSREYARLFRAEQDLQADVRSEMWLQHIGESLGVDRSQVDGEVDKRLSHLKDSEDRQGS